MSYEAIFRIYTTDDSPSIVRVDLGILPFEDEPQNCPGFTLTAEVYRLIQDLQKSNLTGVVSRTVN